ncbi:C2 family cysteine protease [Rubinisphaera margarita]|uniref:C2 family cysteine protease n=1 Tax=Rubinisphaera margarita TaxID=2909586 RepID=UPI001EE8D79F|nr:C2 family cysteine protease [Rubinisphaera margarita]MCG6155128.1 C2 family cysteine protease [Rubinisphaera margarita]
MKSIFTRINRSLSTMFSQPARRRTKMYHSQGEALETRELLSVSKLWMSGSMLVVKTDNASTHVKVRQVGSSVQVEDVGSSKKWNYSNTQVKSVEFQGGNGNDRFVNYYRTLPVRAFGNAGNDYLEGYDGADYLNGGSGNDTLKGFGGNDRLSGGSDNDTIDGGSGNDIAWGGTGNDVLLGGSGDDQLIGEDGNDHLNGGSGADKMWGGAGDDILIAIDNGVLDYIQSDSGRDAIWVDRTGSSTDRMYGNSSSDTVQQVGSFANGADRTLNGDTITPPKVLKSGQTHTAFRDRPLFSTSGPTVKDIDQGGLGDCYFLAGLGAIAIDSPTALKHNIVDFNDGTYGVRYGNSFYRVDNRLAVDSGSSTPAYAGLGAQGSMWVAVAEKAWAHYRTGQNSYASIESGWSVEVNRAFRTSSAVDRKISSFSNAKSFGNYVGTLWNGSQAVTIGFEGDSKKETSGKLILGHQYTVTGVQRDSAGNVTLITLYNPWGTDGAAAEGNKTDGFVTVTPADLFKLAGRVNAGRV